MQTSGLKESSLGGSGHAGKGGRQPAVNPLTSPRLYFVFLQLIDLHLVLPAPRAPRDPWTPRSPTKLCFLLSQSGAARTPLVTSAKNAFFTCRHGGQGAPKVPPRPQKCPPGPGTPAGMCRRRPVWSWWGSGRSSDGIS
uniref:Uncharacterized protein n=1 Tax=Taeniopygia guttata TaxID=59729 RepID=A0A674H3R8_TAEGU